MASTKTYKLIRTKSAVNSDFEAFEYLIRWVGRDGSEYLYMFYDARLGIAVDADIVNADTETLMKSINREVSREITLTAVDVSENDFNIMSQILENPFITRIKKDGTTERMSPVNSSLNYRKLNKRYNIDFTLKRANLATWS